MVRRNLFTEAIPPGQSEPPTGTLPADSDPPGGGDRGVLPGALDVGSEGGALAGEWATSPPGQQRAAPGVLGKIGANIVSGAMDLAKQVSTQDIAGLSSLIEYESTVAAAQEPVDFTNWEERTRLLDNRQKNIMEAATANMDLSAITGEELELRLMQLGLDEQEANNLLGRVGLARAGLGIDQQRIDLDAAGVGESIDFLNQTLSDVDLTEASLGRDLATIADQLSMTDLEKGEIGYQKEDVGDLDEIARTLLAAREALLGEESAVGEGRISVERQRLDLEKESTSLQADRAMKAALRDAYARGASFTTGIREDVTDLDRSRELALDELALRNTGLDLASRELLAQTGYQSTEIEAARDRADIDLDANLRALDMDFTELEFMADRLGRSAADVTDAITRLDTDRLGIQLEISDQTRRLSQLGLDSDEIANQLAELDYDEADVQLALSALELQTEGVGLEQRTLAANDLLNQLAVEREIDTIDLQRVGYSEEKAKQAAQHEEWRKITAAKEDYRADQMEQQEARGGIAATVAAKQAIEQWAPVLAGMTQADAEQITSAFPTLFDEVSYPGATESASQVFIPQYEINPDFDMDFNPTFEYEFNPEFDFDMGGFNSEFDFGGDFGGGDFGGGGGGGGGGPGMDGGGMGSMDEGPHEGDFGGDFGGGDDGGGVFEEPPVDDGPGDDTGLGPFEDWDPPEDPVDSGAFDPGAFEDFDFGSMFGGLFNAAPQATGYTMDPGGRRTTSEDLSGQLGQSDDFAPALLNELGAPVLANNLETLGSWMAAEGTTARFNPLATTKQGGKPGDPDRDQYDQFNEVGVKNYPDFATGVDRTAATLRDSFALPVLEGLMNNVPADVMNTDHLVNAALSTWSGGGYTEFPNVATPGPAYGPPR